jgi:outer membrane receptor protein involved in Fe transport
MIRYLLTTFDFRLQGKQGMRTMRLSSIAAASVISSQLISFAAEQPVIAQAPPAVTAQQLKKLSLEDLMEVQVATVTTASKKEEKATEAPGTVIVIEKNDIRLRGYSTLKDVLRDLPGMETTEYFHGEYGTQVPVRGIVGNNKIVVLVNGMRVNPPGGENFPLHTDFDVRDAEQIEVIYGPGSTLYGRDAASAVINVKTRIPAGPATPPASGDPKNPVPPAPGGGPMKVEIGGDYGLHNERDVWGSFGKVFDSTRNILFNGYVSYHDSDLTRLDREYPAWWKDYKTIAEPKGRGTVPDRQDFGLNAFARLDVGDFSVQGWYRKGRRDSSEGYSPVLGWLPEAVWQDWQAVVEAKYSTKLSDRVHFDSSVNFNWYQVDPNTRFVFPADETHWFFNDYKFSVGYSASVEESLRFDVTKNISLLAGFSYAYYDIVPKSTVPGGANSGDSIAEIQRQGGNFTYYTAPGDPASAHLIPRVAHAIYDVYGGYVEAGWQVTPRLKLLLGERVDKDSRIKDPSSTPRGAVIWNVTDEFTAKYSYTTAYLSPAPYFSFEAFDSGRDFATPNPDLQPEKTSVHEVDFTYTKKNLQLGLALYHGEQENLITTAEHRAPQNIIQNLVFADPAGTSPRSLTHTANGGNSTTNGLDLYGRLRWGPVTPWFSYSYVDFEEKNAGLTTGLQGISHHNGRFGFTWAVMPKLFITPSLVIRSTPENVDPGHLGSELQTPYEVNLYALWQAAEHVDLFANVRNLTDNHYALAGTVGQAIPQEGISGVLGFRIQF